ncbi:MAG: IS21 family transposase [Nocardioidaceae bacterium]
MLNVEDWAEIRRLHLAEGIPIKEIARRLGLARNTVREAVRSPVPPKYERPATSSAVDAVEPDIRRLLARHPRMPASVIAERIGWERGMTVFRERVRDLRPVYLPPDPAGRTTYHPGELAQWDLWFPPVDIPIGAGRVARPPVLVGVAGYSRFMVGRMIPSRETHDLLLGHLACLVDLGRVPRAGVYDNEAAIGRWRRGVPQLTTAFQAFRGAFGMGVILLKPADPEAKGLVERANGYLETSFLPGRRFGSIADFNQQLLAWLPRANGRQHRIIGCRPIDRIAEDRAAMLALPPVLPDPAFRTAIRLPRDHYVRVLSSDYSVHPRAIGRRVDIRADLDVVRIALAGDLVGQHRRSLVPHQVVSDPAHAIARADLRDEYRSLTTRGPEPDVEIRDLAVYDRLVGTPS